MEASAYRERRRLGGQPLLGTAEDGMPEWFRAKMLRLQCLVRDDHEGLLLARQWTLHAGWTQMRRAFVRISKSVVPSTSCCSSSSMRFAAAVRLAHLERAGWPSRAAHTPHARVRPRGRNLVVEKK